MRLGRELGYLDRVTKPSDLRKPDHCPTILMDKKERLYIRTFGLPDTIKQQQAREVFSILKNLSFRSVLDIGCAQGHYSIQTARMYPNSRIKGIDINEEKLKMATKIKEKFGCKNLEFEKMDLSVDSTAEKFDLVLLLQVIEHIEDDRKTLIRIGEIMNSGGHLIITAPNSESKIINWSKKYVSVKGHFRDGYKVSELAKLLTDANFNIDEVRFLSGGIGQLVEKFETYLKIKLPSLLFGLVYPYLNCVAFLDDYLKANDRKHTSGILMVAVQS